MKIAGITVRKGFVLVVPTFDSLCPKDHLAQLSVILQLRNPFPLLLLPLRL